MHLSEILCMQLLAVEAETGAHHAEFVGIHAQPVVHMLIARMLGAGIGDLAAAEVVCVHFHVPEGVSAGGRGSGDGMPAPVGHGAQRRFHGVIFIEGLQAGHVHAHGNGAVAHSQGSQCVGLGQDGIVAGYPCFAVDHVSISPVGCVFVPLLYHKLSPCGGTNAAMGAHCFGWRISSAAA